MYCASSDVEIYFNSLSFTETSAITKAKVDSLIEQRSNYIDAVIGRKYTLPLTESKDLAIMKSICTRLVAGDIDETQSFSILKSDQKKGRDLKKEALEDIQSILEGKIALSSPVSTVQCLDISSGIEVLDENTI
jgi:phage gp36-like protein